MDRTTKKTQILTAENRNMIRSEMSVAHDDFNSTLLRRAIYKTSDSEMSQDLVQTTFLKTIVYLQKGGKIDLMHSFLKHVLNDLIVDEYRKKKVVSLDILLESGFEPSFSDLEKNISAIDGRAIILLLLPQLPKKYELVIRLRYLKGLSLEEISQITGQSKNTVAVQIHRGMAKLRSLHKTNFSE